MDGRLAALLGNTAYTAAIAAAAATVAAADVPVFGAPAAEALSPVNSGGTTRVDGRSQDGGGIPGIVPGDKARDCSGGEVGVVRAGAGFASECDGVAAKMFCLYPALDFFPLLSSCPAVSCVTTRCCCCCLSSLESAKFRQMSEDTADAFRDPSSDGCAGRPRPTAAHQAHQFGRIMSPHVPIEPRVPQTGNITSNCSAYVSSGAALFERSCESAWYINHERFQ